MSMFNIPINRLHFIVCIKRANRKNRHHLYDTDLLVSIKNLKNTVIFNRDNQLICTTNYPVKISAMAGSQQACPERSRRDGAPTGVGHG
jgi:hypothetical protein